MYVDLVWVESDVHILWLNLDLKWKSFKMTWTWQA